MLVEKQHVIIGECFWQTDKSWSGDFIKARIHSTDVISAIKNNFVFPSLLLAS